MNVEGRAASVTDGGAGVGRATSLALAERGCPVLATYSKSSAEAEPTAREVVAKGVKGLAMQADDAACRVMVERSVDVFGQLDVLVNNAGTTSFIPHGHLEKVSDADRDTIFAVNLKGPFQCARAAREALGRDGSGVVANVSSIAGGVGTGSSIPDCASKAGLNLLTVMLARILGPSVRVNAVAPGFISGRWPRGGLGESTYEALTKGVETRAPLQRICESDDVSAAVLSLVEVSDLVTRQVLCVDGGMRIGG